MIDLTLCWSCTTYIIGKLTLKILHSWISKNDKTNNFVGMLQKSGNGKRNGNVKKCSNRPNLY